jgi:LuxR family maltose regulon positive regulatory protein
MASGVHARDVIRAKLAPPPYAPDLLYRQRLIDLIALGAARLTVLEAPAGYGKTTLMAQSHEHCRSRSVKTAWLSIDEEDSHPVIFVQDLLAAIGSTEVEVSDIIVEREPRHAPAYPRGVLASLLNRMRQATEAGVIFIDDLHRAGNSAHVTLLQTFLDNLPASWRAVLASRMRPPIALARYAGAASLCRLGMQELRFTFVEAQRQFSEIPSAQLRSLMQHTDGWPVALQLARVCLRSESPAQSLDRFTGRTPEIATYLAEQVFTSLPLDLQEALMRLSFARRFNGDLVNLLCDRRDGWDLLSEMERRNLFVSPADSEHTWFVFHQLFTEFLQERCRRSGHIAVRELHRTAGAWFLEAGHIDEAIHHTALAADADLGRRIIEKAGGWRVILGGGTPAMRQLLQLSADLAGERSQLQLARTMLLAKEGRFHLARVALEELRERTDGFRRWEEGERDLSTDGFIVDLVLCGYEDRAADIARIEVLERGLHAQPDADPIVAALIHMLHAQAAYATGDCQEACRSAQAGLMRCRSLDASYLEIFGHLNLGLAQLGRAQIEAAEASLWTAMTLSSRVLGLENGLACPLSVVLAEARYLRNDLDDARDLLESALPQLEISDTWFDIWACAVHTDAALALATAGVSAAQARLKWADEVARRRGMSRLGELIAIERIALLTRSGCIDEAEREAGDPRFVDFTATLQGPNSSFRFGLWARAMLASAQLALARGRFRDALRTLEAVEPALIQRAQVRLLVPLRLQKGAAQCGLGDPRGALEALRCALRDGISAGLHRCFIDAAYTVGPLYRLALDAEHALSPAERALLRVALGAANHAADAPDEPGASAPARNRRPELCALSPRESQVLSLLLDGLTNKEMARQLSISESTVVTHRRRLYRKLNVTSRSKAIAAVRSLNAADR